MAHEGTCPAYLLVGVLAGGAVAAGIHPALEPAATHWLTTRGDSLCMNQSI